MQAARLNLEEAHPLPFPLALWIEPTNVCNFKCGFCPESLPEFRERAGYYQHMPTELWGKIARDVTDLGRPKVIRFFHEGEPLLNKNLPAMIQAAGGLTDRTEVFTNGSLLIDRAPALAASGLTYLKVSVYGTTDKEFRDFARTGFGPVAIMEGIRQLRELRAGSAPFIHARLMMPEPTQEQVARFHRQYDSLADRADTMEAVVNWAGSLVHLGAVPMRQVCPMPFYTLAIKANGKVSVCCADWDNRLVVGDVNRTSLREIWQGPALKVIQDTHWSGNRSALEPCRNCTSFYGYPDNLDGHLAKP